MGLLLDEFVDGTGITYRVYAVSSGNTNRYEINFGGRIPTIIADWYSEHMDEEDATYRALLNGYYVGIHSSILRTVGIVWRDVSPIVSKLNELAAKASRMAEVMLSAECMFVTEATLGTP